MNKINYYRATDKMSTLLCDNYLLLQVTSRFGISLGFGDQTVKEVCKINEVDCNTFLSVVNFIVADGDFVLEKNCHISILSLMNYLKKAHHYFLDYQLPAIRKKLLVFLQSSDNQEVTFLILQFFDAYVDELHNHMGYEDKNVFTYVDKLLKGTGDLSFNISKYASSHNRVDTKLTELKNIIIKYLRTNGDNYHTNSMLFDIFACIQDLDFHCRVEDCIFVPAVFNLEKELKLNEQ